jgi:hypothetical protein
MGCQPLANSLKKSRDASEKNFPLTISFCENCCLMQLNETIKKEVLFDQYLWVTGTSEVAKTYAQTFFHRVAMVSGLTKKDIIVEIASNDGTFLAPFIKNEYHCLGVEPAQNIAEIARKNGVPTWVKYWSSETAALVRKEYGAAKVVFARNVISHVSDLHGVIGGIHSVLEEEGVGIIEFHYGGVIIKELHYDSIYHEHLSYFTIKSMSILLESHKLIPFHLDYSPISGGSFVIYFSKKQRPQTHSYIESVQKEKNERLNDLAAWQDFAKRSCDHKDQTHAILKQVAGKVVVGFGASARSSTYLNFCQLVPGRISAIIDNNKMKQGLFTSGTGIPIISAEQGIALKPDVIFVLAWNFAAEIMDECSKRGFTGQYILPFPKEPRLVSCL